MTPKEKAKELFNSFSHILPDAVENDKQTLIDCCLKVLDEMLDFRNRLYLNEGSLAHEYLLNVKEEIEKL